MNGDQHDHVNLEARTGNILIIATPVNITIILILVMIRTSTAPTIFTTIIHVLVFCLSLRV